MAGADKITVKKPAETVQTASNSFPAVQTVSAPTVTDGAFTITFDVQPAPTLENASFADDLGNLPPMRMVSTRPPLPRAMWLGGLTPSAALAAHAKLKQQYFCSCGADAGGWFVRCDPVHYAVEVAPTAEFSAMPVQR
jgi:hypothetical protein